MVTGTLTRFAAVAGLVGLATLVGVVPAKAQYPSCSSGYGGGYTPSYTYYNASYYGGRYYPAGYYYHTTGGWYLQGYGYCTGYASQQYYDTYVAVKKVYASPDEYWSLKTPYNPAPPVAQTTESKMLESLLASQQQQNALLMTALLADKLPAGATAGTGTAVRVPKPTVPTDPSRPYSGEGFSPVVGTPADPLESFVNTTCLECHGGAKGIKGGLDLSDFSRVSADQWRMCGDSVVAGEMPKGTRLANPKGVGRMFYDKAYVLSAKR